MRVETAAGRGEKRVCSHAEISPDHVTTPFLCLMSSRIDQSMLDPRRAHRNLDDANSFLPA